MSVINRALTDIASKGEPRAAGIEPAEIVPVKQSNRLAWAVGGFALSLCVGGWAISQQKESVQPTTMQVPSVAAESETVPQVVTVQKTTLSSPTSKVLEQTKVSLYSVDTPKASEPKLKPKPNNKSTPRSTSVAQVVTESKKQSAKVVTKASGTMQVEQVELTPTQLAKNAIERGKKALDSNKLEEAIKEFQTALRYVATDEVTRKRLAALHYGRKNLRSAVEVLQQGIRLNEESQALRLALSNILMKENQPEAALSPLLYLPNNADKAYLAMRAALAQQTKELDIALETYQILVEKEPENARWWLGLAIGQERKLDYTTAKVSYQQALTKGGVSKQTQAFIRDRLKLLSSLEEESGAN